MNLNLIYGRSGTGKSEYICNDIKKHIGERKIFYVVPEQCNLSAEKKLFDILKVNSLIDVEVLTLSRMAYRVSNEIGDTKNHLSKVGKDMLIFDLISKEKSNLNFLGKSEKNIDIVNRLFTELKKHQVSVQDLEEASIQNQYTNLKLKDITNLYKKYEEKLSSDFIDENDSLTLLAQNLNKTDMFKNSLIYIDEFLGFTKQEYNVFEELIKQCYEITISVPADNLQKDTSKETDIFYFNKKYANKIIDIIKGKNGTIKEIHLDKTYRFKNEELTFLEKNFQNSNGRYKENTENIKLFLASNPYTELEYVAQNIYNLVKNCGYHYNEIGIIAEDVDKYSEDAKAICNKYDIPLFIDNKKELNQNILIKFIIAMLDIFSKNWSFDSVFNYLKIGLLDIEDEDIYLLENYCRKWGVRGSKFYNRELSYEQINDIQEKLENIRKQICDPLLEFKKNVSINKDATQITKEIYNFLDNNKIFESLNTKLKTYNNIEISDEYNTSYKILIEILEEICLIFGDDKMTFDKYKQLLEVGLSASKLGKIPATQDQVVLGDTERTRSNKLKVVFIIGINDGTFPKANRVEGYFNDADRQLLREEARIELAKDSIDSLYEEQFNIYRTLTTPEEKLFLSYSSSDKEGKSIRPSILIKKIKRIFPNIKEESDIINKEFVKTNEKATFEEILNVYKDYLEGKKITKSQEELLRYFFHRDKSRIKRAVSGIYYSNKSENISEENIEKLYGNSLKTSVSRLESYRRCPFSFHLTYGLKLKEKEEIKIESMSTGSFMHEVIDEFFKKIDEKNMNIKDITDEEILEIVNSIVNELLQMSKYYTFSSSAKFRLLTKRLKKIVYQSICYIVYSLKYSDFSVLDHEIEFNNTGKYKTIKLEVDNKNVEITGKIDRVDTAKLADKQYVRIIDYKSSTKDLDMNQILSGLQIQLITYLDAICNQTDLNPSGLLYMGLIDNVVKNAKNLTDEEIENKIRNNFKMKGLILADISVVKLMDNKLQTGSSDIIPVCIKKDGTLSESKSSVISKENFEKLQSQVKEIIKDISKEILKGKIDIKPYNYNKKTGCDYCKYKTICMFNTNIKGNEYNYINKIK